MRQNSLFLALILVLATACNDKEKKAQLVQQEINSLVESYRQRRVKECLSAALDSANRIVDSIIIAQNTQMDTSLLMGRPVKPPKPVLKSPLDTTPVEPILKKKSNG